MFLTTMARVVAVALLICCTSSCNRSGEGTSTHKDRPDACITPEAEQVTHQPDFAKTYTYCTTGSRAVPPPALIACLHDRSGLPEECASCYSWYKACVLRNCFNMCNTPRPEPYCLLCRRNFCSGQFYRCGGTSDVFPGLPK